MDGLTLMELVLTVVILAVIAAVVAPVVTTGTLAVVQGRDAATAEAEATLALERFVRDVRRAQSVQGADGMAADSITLELTDAEVTYRLADSRLTRNGQVLARRVNTSASESFFRVDRIPANAENDGEPHVTLSLRMATSQVPYRATGVPR